MKVKLQEIADSRELLEEFSRQPVNASLSFKLLVVFRQIEPHLIDMARVHKEIRERYGVVGENGKKQIPPESQADADKEWQELMNTEVKLTGVGKISISEFERSDVEFRPADAAKLAWLVKLDSFDTE
jgi:hypothetical protein